MSACSKFSCSVELLLELTQGCSPHGISHFPSARLRLGTEDSGSRCGATADSEGGVPEEPAASRKSYGQKDGDNRGQPGGSGKKMVMTVSKEGEGRAGKVCKSFHKVALGSRLSAVRDTACSLPTEGRVGTR